MVLVIGISLEKKIIDSEEILSQNKYLLLCKDVIILWKIRRRNFILLK